MRYHLRVTKARPPAVAGAEFEVDGDVTVGRDPTCDIVLDDPRVSRAAAVLSPRPGGVWARRTGSGSMWIDGVEVAEGLVPTGGHLQLGGVLARVDSEAAETEGDVGPMSLFAPVSAPPLLRVDVDQQRASLCGVELDLRPGPFLTLLALAERAPDWVPAEVLAIACWGPQLGPRQVAYLPKYVSYVRASMRHLLADSAVMSAVIGACSGAGEPTDGAEPGPVLLSFLKARKKVGFRLSAPAGAVVISRRST